MFQLFLITPSSFKLTVLNGHIYHHTEVLANCKSLKGTKALFHSLDIQQLFWWCLNNHNIFLYLH